MEEATSVKVTEYSRPVPQVENLKGCTPVYRCVESLDKLITNFDPPMTKVYEIFQRAVAKYAKNKCFGTQVLNAQGKPEYKWITYEEVEALVNKAAKFVQRYKLANQKYNFVGITAKNSNEWMITDLALSLIGCAPVPFYQRLSADACKHIVVEAELDCMFGFQADLIHLLDQGHPSITKLVCFDKPSEELKAKAGTAKLFDFWAELEDPELDKCELVIPDNITLETTFTISYTSGTTGVPKGAIVSNKNMISCMLNVVHHVNMKEDDVLISFLPLAHVFGRVVYFQMLAFGGSIGNYGGDIKKIVEDINILKPTFFPCVPRLFNRIYDLLTGGIEKLDEPVKEGVKKLLAAKMEIYKKTGQVVSEELDKHPVLANFRGKLGGRVRIALTASAPLSVQVFQFLRVALSVDFREAYGQTESSGGSFGNQSLENRAHICGGPFVGTELKLEDVEDMNYLSTDKPYPRGEICIRGPGVFPGYFKNPEKTKEAIDENGWLHSGDVGMIVEGGALRIIDRKKNIFKLSQGEYIAPENLESVYRKCPLVQSLMIHGSPLKSYIVAVIVPEEEVVKVVAKQQGWEGDFKTLCKSKELRKAVQDQLQKEAEKEKLNSLEFIKDNFELSPTPWPEVPAQILTSTQKLRRHQATEYYMPLFKEIYERNE